MKKWFIIGLIGTIILAVVLTITVQIILEENSQQEIYQQRAEVQEEEENRELVENELAMTSSTGEDKISPNAVIYFKTYYASCKHTTTETVDVPEELVNKTREDVAEKYKDWDIGEFTNQEITLYCEQQGICPEHYMIREKDGYIAIYQIGEDGTETLKEMTGIVTNYLPETDILRLEEGIKVVGKEELNATIEDYE